MQRYRKVLQSISSCVRAVLKDIRIEKENFKVVRTTKQIREQ